MDQTNNIDTNKQEEKLNFFQKIFSKSPDQIKKEK
jgi:hypothetical protein